MLAAVKGYYDGTQIVVDEEDRKSLSTGDELIITILDRRDGRGTETREEKRKRLIESEAFVSPSGGTDIIRQ